MMTILESPPKGICSAKPPNYYEHQVNSEQFPVQYLNSPLSKSTSSGTYGKGTFRVTLGAVWANHVTAEFPQHTIRSHHRTSERDSLRGVPHACGTT